jgi:hypothetical protein
LGLPYDDVIRLLGSARSGGGYGSSLPGARSPLERYALLWRALEQLLLARSGEEADNAVIAGLTAIETAQDRKGLDGLSALSEEVRALSRLSQMRLAGLVDPGHDGRTSVDWFRRQLRLVAHIPTRGNLDARTKKAVASVLRHLRNAVVHAGAVTTDKDLSAVFVSAAHFQERLIAVLYSVTFQISVEEVDAAVASRST